MCTLVVLSEHVKGYPLIVAANRDERYDRKSKPPEVHGSLIYPQDEEKGGTWMGIDRGGWFVGITNQDDGKHDDHALSRGKVVSDCLTAKEHRGAALALKKLELERYNPFNLVFGRPGVMFLARAWAGHELEMLPIEQGITVVSNDCWGHCYDKKCELAESLTRQAVFDPMVTEYDTQKVASALLKAMSSHDNATQDDPFQALCVHAEEHAFGTRSTSIITVSSEGNVEYWYSEGHPCKSPGLTLVARLPHQ